MVTAISLLGWDVTLWALFSISAYRFIRQICLGCVSIPRLLQVLLVLGARNTTMQSGFIADAHQAVTAETFRKGDSVSVVVAETYRPKTACVGTTKFTYHCSGAVAPVSWPSNSIISSAVLATLAALAECRIC